MQRRIQCFNNAAAFHTAKSPLQNGRLQFRNQVFLKMFIWAAWYVCFCCCRNPICSPGHDCTDCTLCQHIKYYTSFLVILSILIKQILLSFVVYNVYILVQYWPNCVQSWSCYRKHSTAACCRALPQSSSSAACVRACIRASWQFLPLSTSNP